MARALDTLRADPNLENEHKARRLRWREVEPMSVAVPEEDSHELDFLSWVARIGRVLMWLMVTAVLGGIVVNLVRYSGRRRRPTQEASSLPTHVQDLDIRPDVLPEDVGGAALELWQRGERRACLALLYRGLLSRLAHAHDAPITAASTEGDCVQLARTHLPEPSQGYAQQLVRVWQGAVYGAREPDEVTVRALCEGFATALPAAKVSPSP